jgi:hypothetical protein
VRRWKTYDAAYAGNGTTITPRQMVDMIIAELGGSHVVALGPLVLGTAPGVPPYYAAICSADNDGFFSVTLGACELNDALLLRRQLQDRLHELGKVALPYETEAELAAACERLWPSERTREIRAQVKAGR